MDDRLFNHKDLGSFLRARRERLSPKDFGIPASPSRRTPGLRREEVAFLASIGVKWYARLEAGDETNPSPKTLLAVSKAMRLSRIDTEYLFNLAGLSPPPSRAVDYTFQVPDQVLAMMADFRGVATSVWDLLLTPLAWNGIFDAVMECSTFSTPLERNLLVQGLGPSGFLRELTGSDFERLASNAIGMLRRYYTSVEPTDFARLVYEEIKDSPVFQELWKSHTVADFLNDGKAAVVREHPKLGTLTLYPIDLYLHYRDDIVLKVWRPADDRTARVFRDVEARALDKVQPGSGVTE